MIGTYEELAPKFEARYGGITDSTTIEFKGIPEGKAREILQDLKKVTSPFTGFALDWS